MSIDVGAEFMLDLGSKVGDIHHRLMEKHGSYVNDRPFTFAIPTITAAGNYDNATQLSPNAGYMWCVRRLTLTPFTVTSGSLTILLDNQEPLVNITAGATAVSGPSINFFVKGGILMTNTSRLTVQWSGLTVAPLGLYGRADEFLTDYLDRYLDL